VRYAPPQASFLAWLDCRELGVGDDPAAVFQEKGAVPLGRGPRFGAEGHGFARLTMGTSPELMEQAVRRMASAL
jgi:cysteine-S-conjugate beta-lyase